jgi:putative transposase
MHSYAWMTNHIHLLATPAYEDSISKTFQSAGRKYVQYFNFTYHRSGTLWEGRYRATVVDTEHYFLRVMRYIEQNPVRAGMVSHPRDYPWSSHRKYAYGDDGANLNWLIEHDEYLKLGRDAAARKVAYRELFRSEIESDVLASIRDCTHKGWALGDTRFREEISGLSDRRAAPAARGRPRVQETRVKK